VAQAQLPPEERAGGAAGCVYGGDRGSGACGSEGYAFRAPLDAGEFERQAAYGGALKNASWQLVDGGLGDAAGVAAAVVRVLAVCAAGMQARAIAAGRGAPLRFPHVGALNALYPGADGERAQTTQLGNAAEEELAETARASGHLVAKFSNDKVDLDLARNPLPLCLLAAADPHSRAIVRGAAQLAARAPDILGVLHCVASALAGAAGAAGDDAPGAALEQQLRSQGLTRGVERLSCTARNLPGKVCGAMMLDGPPALRLAQTLDALSVTGAQGERARAADGPVDGPADGDYAALLRAVRRACMRLRSAFDGPLAPGARLLRATAAAAAAAVATAGTAAAAVVPAPAVAAPAAAAGVPTPVSRESGGSGGSRRARGWAG
jgi:hypothetical protein